MAQTRRRRQTKHRGNAAGVIEARGRTGRKPTASEKSTPARGSAGARQPREARPPKPPTWRGSALKAAGMAVVVVVVMVLLHIGKASSALPLLPFILIMYTPISYYTDRWAYQRRLRTAQGKGRDAR